MCRYNIIIWISKRHFTLYLINAYWVNWPHLEFNVNCWNGLKISLLVDSKKWFLQKVVLNGYQSCTSPVISEVPQESVLGPLLCIIFIYHLPIVPYFCMFADDAKILWVIRTEEDYTCTAFQNDLNALHAWFTIWQLKFNILKCKLFHLGPHHSYGLYFLNGTEIERTTQHKDLGILFDDKLKFHDRTSTVAGKGNRMLGLISQSFEFLEPETVGKLYEVLVQPILEYSNPVWGLTFILDQRRIENVQRRATWLVPCIRNSTYSERLAMLDLPSMNYRQKRGDLILMYKIIKNYFNSDFSNMITFSPTTTTKGHNFKLFKQQSRLKIRSNFYFSRILSMIGTIYCKMR